MKTKTFTTMGALHPVLFFVGVYVVALFFSIFICSSLFYSCKSSSSSRMAKEQKIPLQKSGLSNTMTTAAVMR
jgi:hypothetical protein